MLKLGLHRLLKMAHGADVPFSTDAHYAPILLQDNAISYPRWSDVFDTPPDEWLVQQEARHRHAQPLVILIRHTGARADDLCLTLTHLLATRGYPWQAFVVTAGPAESEACRQTLETTCGSDARITVCHALPELSGQWVMLIEGTPRPRVHAPVTMIHYLTQTPDAWMAYADEDDLRPDGTRANPWFKPEFSPLLARQGVLTGRILTVNARSPEVGAWLSALRPEHDWEQRWISLACQAPATAVVHIPLVLFSDPTPPPLRPLPPLPAVDTGTQVSIIIPTRDRWDLLGPCLESIRRSQWPASSLDIIIIDNGSTDRTTLQELDKAAAAGTLRVLRDDGIFNWARLNNLGARHSRGDVLIFLNNDTEVIDGHWIEKLVGRVSQPGTGAVGCKLLYPDRTVQHAGVILGIRGLASHAHLYAGENEPGYRGLATLTREVGAVTGACIGVSRSAFDAVGGFREQLRVAFNDIVFCLDLIDKGYTNVCLADALLIHYESKTRGYDDNAEKVALLLQEARIAWGFHQSLLRHDPFYSPNFSLERGYEPAIAPRHPRPWTEAAKKKQKIMLLSCTHAVGHGVAVVIALHAEALLRAGFDVVMAGPRSGNDFPYEGCERMEVHDPYDAVFLAARAGVDLIVAHTPPFFSVARWTGLYPRVIAYDYGEPPCDWFPDAIQRKGVQTEKMQALVMADRVFAISDAVAAESQTPVTGVIALGNAHLGAWNDSRAARRQQIRAANGWENTFVVLNVCRFHEGERHYKGVDAYVSVMKAATSAMDSCVFLQAGKGTLSDVQHLEAQGLTVRANITDDEMIDLYCAADAYLNFSRWEGYNLGIGQALAMGLPTLASDIPAHRAFGIRISDDIPDIVQWLLDTRGRPTVREARIQPWEPSLSRWVQEIRGVLEERHAPLT